jgi:hypothetical protein
MDIPPMPGMSRSIRYLRMRAMSFLRSDGIVCGSPVFDKLKFLAIHKENL